uniref:Uncharacterized protein n=1 Tax=Chelonoidis abingdonii TaxID=106734 RepID=A0A8C0IU46_CHEAB
IIGTTFLHTFCCITIPTLTLHCHVATSMTENKNGEHLLSGILHLRKISMSSSTCTKGPLCDVTKSLLFSPFYICSYENLHKYSFSQRDVRGNWIFVQTSPLFKISLKQRK